MSIISKLLLLTFLISYEAFSVDMKVLFVEGSVHKISLESKKISLNNGDILTEGDILITGENSFAVVTIKGHSTHKVEENSELTIASLPYYYKNSKELDQGAHFLLKVGTIFSDVVSSKGKKALSIKSNNTVMGVRGTKLLVSRNKQTQDVWLLVKTGEVEIHNQLSGDKDILIRDQGLLVEEDRTFTAVKRYSFIKDLSWDMSPASKVNAFSLKKKQVEKEFLAKKSKWNRNDVIYGEKQKRWEREEREFKSRTQDLESVKLKVRRKAQVKESISKRPKDLANGIMNKSKIRRNDFLELSKKRKIQRKLDQNDILENRNKNRPKPKKTQPIPDFKPVPSSNNE